MFVTTVSVLLVLSPATSNAEVPNFPHLPPASYMAPLVPGFHQLTWVGQWKIPPRPEFTNIPRLEVSDKQNYSLNYGVTVFPRCSKEVLERCISSIEYKKPGEVTWSSAAFVKYLPVSTQSFNSMGRDRYLKWSTESLDSKRNAFWPLDSSRSSLWELETSLGKQIYLASVSLQYDATFDQFSQFKLSLTPVTEIFVKDASSYKDLDPNNSWCARTGYGDSFFRGSNFHPLTDADSASGTYDYCLVNSSFSSDTVFRINTQLSPDFREKRFANWVMSRTTDTRAFSKSTGTSKPIIASFEGSPATIQVGVTQVPRTLDGFNSWWSGSPFKKSYDVGKFNLDWFENLKKNWGIDTTNLGGEGWHGAGWEAIDQWNSTEKYIDPSLTIEHQVWEFSVIALEEAGDNWVAKCKGAMNSSRSFSGVVSTNATVFVQGPPRLQNGGNLDFQVASTHLKQNGEVNLGTYNLSVDQSVAKCIWGTSSLGAGASISVISQDGATQIATTSMGTSEGQLNFAAGGFHYSTNKISISLGAKESALANSTPVDKSTSLKRTTLTCVKGKVNKKVTAVKPKCPAGFKKK